MLAPQVCIPGGRFSLVVPFNCRGPNRGLISPGQHDGRDFRERSMRGSIVHASPGGRGVQVVRPSLALIVPTWLLRVKVDF